VPVPQRAGIALLAQIEHGQISLAGANDDLRMDDAAEDIDLSRGQFRKAPPRIEACLEPFQESGRIERFPIGQFVPGYRRPSGNRSLSSGASRSIWPRLILASTAMWQNGKA
jgi:hypothetical protein